MKWLERLLRAEQVGLLAIITLMVVGLTLAAGSHVDEATGRGVNNFFCAPTLLPCRFAPWRR